MGIAERSMDVTARAIREADNVEGLTEGAVDEGAMGLIERKQHLGSSERDSQLDLAEK